MEMIVTNTRAITAYGEGLHYSVYEKPARFMIDTDDMQGDLKVRIEYVSKLGPNSIVKSNLDRIDKHLCQVTYQPTDVGLIKISILWNGKDIPNSPFTAVVTNPGLCLKRNK